MPLDDDLLELTDVTPDGARLKQDARAIEKLMKVTTGCPCDACPLTSACQVECVRFRGWVQTGRC